MQVAVGSPVTLRNLVSRPDLNGMRGIVRSVGNRIGVVTDGGEGVRVRPENVTLRLEITLATTPEGSAPNLPHYAAWMHTKFPGAHPSVLAGEPVDPTQPINAMAMQRGTTTILVFEEQEPDGVNGARVHEGRASDLLLHCKVDAYRALSVAQQAMLDAHGGCALVEYQEMRLDPEDPNTTIAHGVFLPDSLDMSDCEEMKAAMMAATTMPIAIMMAPAP